MRAKEKMMRFFGLFQQAASFLEIHLRFPKIFKSHYLILKKIVEEWR